MREARVIGGFGEIVSKPTSAAKSTAATPASESTRAAARAAMNRVVALLEAPAGLRTIAGLAPESARGVSRNGGPYLPRKAEWQTFTLSRALKAGQRGAISKITWWKTMQITCLRPSKRSTKRRERCFGRVDVWSSPEPPANNDNHEQEDCHEGGDHFCWG